MTDTNLLGEVHEAQMPPTMLAWTIPTTAEKCNSVLEERVATIRSSLQAQGAAVSVTQNYCSESHDLEITLEAMHAIPICTKNGIRSYEIPMG